MTNGNSAEMLRFEKWYSQREQHDSGLIETWNHTWEGWQARAALSVCADGGKGEAVYQVLEDLNTWTDVEYDLFENIETNARRIVYTAPQAECAPREAQPGPTPERADAEKDAAPTNEQIEAAIEAWFDTDGKDVDDHQSRMRAAILAANKEPERAQESAAVLDAIEDVAKYFEDCGDPYGAKMIADSTPVITIAANPRQ
jgi:hypothetical protein